MFHRISLRNGAINTYWRKTGLQAYGIIRNSESATAAAFHPDCRRLAIGGRNGMLQVWDLAGVSPASRVFPHRGAVRNAFFTPEGKRVMTNESGGRTRIWRIENDAIRFESEVQHASIESVNSSDLNWDASIWAIAGGSLASGH